MQRTEEYYDTQLLQIEEAKRWIRTRFINEVDISVLPIEWASVWAVALTELGAPLTAQVVARTQGEN
jgi:hypothetical protein